MLECTGFGSGSGICLRVWVGFEFIGFGLFPLGFRVFRYPTSSLHIGLPSGGSPVNGNAGGSSVNNLGVYQRFDEDVKLPLIKVVVLGAPGVGKTSVVKVIY